MDARLLLSVSLLWVFVLCLIVFDVGAENDSGDDLFDRTFLNTLPVIPVNESPVAVPMAEDGSLYRFKTAEPGFYRVRTYNSETQSETPVDTILLLFDPDENGHPDLLGANDDVQESDPRSELNRNLEGETEYVFSVEPFIDTRRPLTEEIAATLNPRRVGVQITGPIHPSVYPIGEVIGYYDFGQTLLEQSGWAHIPGGFNGWRGGSVEMVSFPEDTFETSEDNRGVSIRVRGHSLSFLYLEDAIESTGKPIVVRMTYRATGDNAQVFLAAMRGHLKHNRDLEGSVSVNQVNDLSRAIEEEQTLELIYRQPKGTYITPLVQLVGTGRRATVYIDRVVIHELDSNGIF